MSRVASWNNMGVDVNGLSKVEEVLQKSGLDYDVIKRPLKYREAGTWYTVPDKSVNVRKDNPAKVFGVVGSKYEICQNRDAFDFVNCINGDVKFVKAGETKSGIIYLISELPEIEVLGDKIKPNLIFQNAHNGLSSIRANICMLRIVCQNQFAHAFKDASNAINIKHTNRSMFGKLENAKEVLANTYEYIANYTDNAERLAVKKVDDKVLQNIISEMILNGKSMSSIESGSKEDDKVTRFINAYNNDDNMNFRGTAWGIINAWTDYSTHMIPERQSKNFEESRFINNTFNNKSLDKVVRMVEAE